MNYRGTKMNTSKDTNALSAKQPRPLKKPHKVRDRLGLPADFPKPIRPAGISEENYTACRERVEWLTQHFLTTRLRALYQAFDGDLTTALILGEIANRNIESLYMGHDRFFPRYWGALPLIPCHIPDIENVTGIPRETISRKVDKLIELGWVERAKGGLFAVPERIGDAFAAFDDSQVDSLLRLGRLIERMLLTGPKAGDAVRNSDE